MTVLAREGLRIEGYASLWGVADLNRDVVAKGAFAASLSRDYLATLDYAYDALDMLDDDQTELNFNFNVAQRHENGLYFILTGDRSGDMLDTIDDVHDSFGQPIIDFIADACRLLNIPFYPND